MDSFIDVRTVERSGGMLDAGRRLFAAIWEHAEVRLELLTVELAEERARLVNTAVAAGLVVVCVLVLVWETEARIWVAIALPVLFVLGAFVSFMILRRLISRKAPLFRH